MINIPALTAQTIGHLKIDEGFRSRPYLDTENKLTLGYGWNLDRPIRLAEAELRLRNDVSEAIAECAKNFPWFGELDLDRQSVLVNMAFNLGINRLLMFKKTLAAIEAHDFSRAAEEMINSMWATQVKDRAVRLAAIMKEGSGVIAYPDIPVAPLT